MGRLSKLTSHVQTTLVAALSEGASIPHACEYAGIQPQTYYNWMRRSAAGEPLLVACNFTPVPREGYRIGVPRGGRWRERLNSDASEYGGSGQGNLGALQAEALGAQGFDYSLNVRLPPLAVVVLTPD